MQYQQHQQAIIQQQDQQVQQAQQSMNWNHYSNWASTRDEDGKSLDPRLY